jgi:hypothetical protein
MFFGKDIPRVLLPLMHICIVDSVWVLSRFIEISNASETTKKGSKHGQQWKIGDVFNK